MLRWLINGFSFSYGMKLYHILITKERMLMIRISEFQSKDVVNVFDGKKLGNIGDIDIDVITGKIQAIVIGKQGKMLGLLRKEDEVTIPWRQIVKIGEDVILVRMQISETSINPAVPTTFS